MRYRAHHLALFAVAGVVSTVAFLWATVYFVEPRLSDPRPLHEFLFNRTPIQWCTLTVFFFVLSIQPHRFFRNLRLARDLRRLKAGHQPRGGVVGERLRRLSACKINRGSGGASRLAVELAVRDEDELGRIYGLLQNAVQLMLALGFLGTVWGISRSLSGSFGLFSGADTEQLRLGLENFTLALSTALDTSILGLACSLIGTVVIAIGQWVETNSLGALSEGTSQALELEPTVVNDEAAPRAPEGDRSDTDATPSAEAQAAIDSLAARSAELYETKLAEALERHLAHFDENERQLFASLSEALGRHLAMALRTLDEHGCQLRAALTTELQSIARELQRVPEVSIRYPGANSESNESSES